MRRVIDALDSGLFAPDEPGLFRPLRDTLLSDNERYFHLADLVQYREAQAAASALFQDQTAWARKALLTIARMGPFSSDRTIQEYADEIWTLKAVL